MFYYASKLLWVIFTPSTFIVLMLALGAYLYVANTCIWRRIGGTIFLTSFALLVFCGLGPGGSLLIIPLEARFPSIMEANAPPPTGIIILGGAVEAQPPFSNPDMLNLNQAGERVTALLMLARRYPQAKLVFTGGQGDLFTAGIPEADQVRAHIGLLGLDPARIIFEDRSRNTVENAVFTADIVHPKPGERYLLVTSAWHMPRSIGCFRQAGFDVEAFPVDFRSNGWSDAFRLSGSISGGLQMTDVAVREWIGLVAYWATGKTSALFPS